jgi:hypothetical protein
MIRRLLFCLILGIFFSKGYSGYNKQLLHFQTKSVSLKQKAAVFAQNDPEEVFQLFFDELQEPSESPQANFYRIRPKLQQVRNNLSQAARPAQGWSYESFFPDEEKRSFQIRQESTIPFYYTFLFRLTPF